MKISSVKVKGIMKSLGADLLGLQVLIDLQVHRRGIIQQMCFLPVNRLFLLRTDFS